MIKLSRVAMLAAASAVSLAESPLDARAQSTTIATLGPYGFGDVAPSPDGKLVLVAVDSALMKVDMATRAVSRVALGEFYALALSPSGDRIAFQRWTGDVPALWTARFDGARGTLDSIAKLSDSAQSPVFAPDGRRIAVKRPFGATDSLAVVSITGGRVAIPAAGGRNVQPSGWSRDGRAIYYTANLGGPLNHAVYKLDLTGGTTRTLVERNTDELVRISPDERYILYRPSSAKYSVATIDGKHVADIDIERRNYGRDIGDPKWMPGSSSIIFSAQNVPRALVANALDGSEHNILSDSTIFTVSPAVSPDGRWLAAVTAGPGKPQVLIRSMVTNETRLIDVGMSIAAFNQALYLHWAPNGRYLGVPVGTVDAFIGHTNPEQTALVDVQTSRVMQVAQGASAWSVWSPDSRTFRYAVSWDSSGGVRRPMEVHEAPLGGADRFVRRTNQCCGGARFSDFEHVYTKADGQLMDIRTGETRTVLDPVNRPVPDPGNVIPTACFTADGRYAAVPTSATGKGAYNRVMIISLETGERRLLDPGVTRITANSIFCHPDSKRFVTAGLDSARASQVVSVSLDGSRQVIGPIDRDSYSMVLMAFTPDGKWLITSRRMPPGPIEIVTQVAIPGGRP